MDTKSEGCNREIKRVSFSLCNNALDSQTKHMKAHPEEAAHYDSDDFETADEWSVSSSEDDQVKQSVNGVDNVPVTNALREWRQCKKRGPPSFSNTSLQAFKTFFKSKEHEAKQTADALWRHEFHPPMGVVGFLAKA